MPNFGISSNCREYRTTADDRRVRYDLRSQAGGQVENMPTDNANSDNNLVEARNVDADRMLPDMPSPPPPLRDIVNNDSLLDLDNSVLEMCVNRNETGQVGLRVIRPINNEQSRLIDTALDRNSPVSQYADVVAESFRRPHVLPQMSFPRYGNMSTPINARHAENVRFPVMCPDSQFGQVQVVQTPSGLSKTDKTVTMELIRHVNPISGSSEEELVRFLKQLKPIFELNPEYTPEIIKLLIPKVTGQLFTLWMRAVSLRVGWDILHTEILNYFLTPLRLRELQMFVVERPQQPTESFMDYVEEIIASAFALKVHLTESDVIESVLGRCLPETRVHFSFDSKPRTIDELRLFAGRVSNSIKSDQRYFGYQGRMGGQSQPPLPLPSHNNGMMPSRPSPTAPGYTLPAQHPTPPAPHHSFGLPPLDSRNYPRVIICHRCGYQGHLARNCRASLNC